VPVIQGTPRDEDHLIARNNRRMQHIQDRIDRFTKMKTRLEEDNVQLAEEKVKRLEKEAKDKEPK